jgi:hypothetical protein
MSRGAGGAGKGVFYGAALFLSFFLRVNQLVCHSRQSSHLVVPLLFFFFRDSQLNWSGSQLVLSEHLAAGREVDGRTDK